MTFTVSNLGLRDREYAKFVGGMGAGSEAPINVAISSGNINIGSVSAIVESVYVQSGNIQPIDGNTVFGVSGTNLNVQQGTSPWTISGTATIGSQAALYVILCGIQSGTTTVLPLICNDAGTLLFSGVA